MSDYDEQAFTLKSYTPDAAEVWNACVAQTRSASFLFFRAYMDYHASRFTDASLLFYARRGQLLAVLPACQSPADTSVVVSHAGLTYGGLLTTSAVTTSLACHMLRAACRHYAAQGYREFIYKPAPYIYKEYPAEEDLYALFRLKGRLCTRAASSVISLAQPLPWSTLRRRKVRKAALQPALVVESDAAHVAAFWQLLDVVLSTRHGVHPVHTLAEMQMLMERFPRDIRLFTVHVGADKRLCAGCLMYFTRCVAHVQYIAASDEGRDIGALDYLFSHLLAHIEQVAPGSRYFDFGISTEQGGSVLNEGLIFQKEGYGARTVCYDSYVLPLGQD